MVGEHGGSIPPGLTDRHELPILNHILNFNLNLLSDGSDED
jgi:hypothetical protein